MKKIIYAGAFILSCSTVNISRAQAPEFSYSGEKKELRQEKKQIATEEKSARREETTARHSEVNNMTRQQFRLDFPQAQNPSYYVGKRFDEVFYTQDGERFTAYYDETSSLVGTTTTKQFEDIPKDAQEKIMHRYIDKGYSLNRVILFNDNEATDTDMWLYENQFDDTDTYFVELNKDGRMTVLQVDMDGEVSFFKKI